MLRLVLLIVYAVGTVGVVVLASLAPFKFAPFPPLAEMIARIGWPPSDIEDVAVNGIIYVLVGISLWRVLRLATHRPLALVALVGGCAAAMSVAVEALQTCLPARCASWIDVLVNSGGAIGGALLGPTFMRIARYTVERMRRRVRLHPVTAAANLLTLVIVFTGLLPFDVITTAEGLADSLAGVRWAIDWEAFGLGGLASGVSHVVAQSAIGGVLLFAALGYMAGLAGRERGATPWNATAAAIRRVMVLAVTVEAMQILLASRVTDLADVVLAIIGGVAGTCVAIWVAPIRTAGVRRAGLAVPLPLPLPLPALVAAAVACVLYLAADSVLAPEWSLMNVSTTNILWLPLATRYHQHAMTASADLMGDFLIHGGLAALLAMVIRRVGSRAGSSETERTVRSSVPWTLGGALSVLVVAAVLAIESGSSGGLADATHVLSALAAAVFVADLGPRIVAAPTSNALRP